MVESHGVKRVVIKTTGNHHDDSLTGGGFSYNRGDT